MKTYYECLPCFINQALGALKRSGANDNQIKIVMRKVLSELALIDFNTSPPLTASKIHRLIRETVNVKHPYAVEKHKFNNYAMELLSEIKTRITGNSNTFLLKVKLSIAANLIDFGGKHNLTEKDVFDCFSKAKDIPIDNSAVLRLQEEIHSAEKILYLCDNAGEIVFDRYLIEAMPCQKITCAVRGAPVINDATLEDARDVGLTNVVNVISNGSDVPGTVLHLCSNEFRLAFDDADVIIAKGQGNFETLSEITDKRIFFIFQVKCPVIASDIGFPVGAFVIKDNLREYHLNPL
jgi:uncharacterized protein with ATP-grasp and redox domains